MTPNAHGRRAPPRSRPRALARPLRVALVTDTFAPATNGVVRSVVLARESLERLGACVRVLAPGAPEDAVQDPSVTLFPAVETNLYPHLRLAVLPIHVRHLAGADVVHVHTPGLLGASAVLAARRLGVPSVYTYHTRFEDLVHYMTPYSAAERVLERLAAAAHRRLFRAVNAVVAPTPAVADELTRAFGVEAEVVPTGVDPRRFAPRPVVRDPADDGPRLLHVGRLSREKNLEAVLRAMPAVLRAAPRARLLVAGAGPDLARSRALARALRLGDAVSFLGFVPEEELPALYASADVFVTASTFETQGLTVYEAMAAGAACAVPDVPVFRELRHAAVHFDPTLEEDVARAVLEARARRAELGARARRVAEAHSADACVARLLALYERLASGRLGSGPEAAGSSRRTAHERAAP